MDMAFVFLHFLIHRQTPKIEAVCRINSASYEFEKFRSESAILVHSHGVFSKAPVQITQDMNSTNSISEVSICQYGTFTNYN